MYLVHIIICKYRLCGTTLMYCFVRENIFVNKTFISFVQLKFYDLNIAYEYFVQTCFFPYAFNFSIT